VIAVTLLFADHLRQPHISLTTKAETFNDFPLKETSREILRYVRKQATMQAALARYDGSA